MRSSLAALVAWFVVVSCRAGAAQELPAGKFVSAKYLELCVEPLAGHRLRLTAKSPDDRQPVVVEGPYQITATKMGDYHVSLAIDSIKTKVLSHCRKNWVDADLPMTLQLGVEMKRGQTLRLTMRYECIDGHVGLQLCIHADAVVCRELRREPAESCTAPPPIDGSRINPPPR